MIRWGRMTRTILVAFVFGFGAATLTEQTVQAAEEVNIVDGYAVHGYDVVAYFTDGKPTEGDSSYTADHNGATYRFANAGNRDAFAADPGKYAPQYGGYCAYGTAQGRKFDGDPTAWRIVDDKLYLNLNANVQKIWLKDVPGYVRGADNNWPIIRPIPDSQLASTSPEGITLGAQ